MVKFEKSMEGLREKPLKKINYYYSSLSIKDLALQSLPGRGARWWRRLQAPSGGRQSWRSGPAPWNLT